MSSPFLSATLAWALLASAAVAQTPPTGFSDVPEGFWAAHAVKDVAIDRHFMRGYPDGTFKGEQPFTRIQLALATSELLKELEIMTKTSWASPGLGGYQFKDLPAGSKEQQIAVNLADNYRLFDEVPGVTSETLEADKVVTRYEMAKVVDRLMHLGQAHGVIDPAVLSPHLYTFSDLPVSAWDADAVQEVADTYQVMIGFPDGTFRGPEELTRYQFAAAADQTFPLVRELVEKTQAAKNATPASLTPSRHFLETTPLQLAFSGSAALGGLGRGVVYGKSFFLLGQAGVTFVPQGNNLYRGDLNLGYAFDLGPVSLQPYAGAMGLTGSGAAIEGLNYGLLAYFQPLDSLGLYAQAQGASVLSASSQGLLLGSGGLGVIYFFNPHIGLSLEARLDSMPESPSFFATPTGATAGPAAYAQGYPDINAGLAIGF